MIFGCNIRELVFVNFCASVSQSRHVCILKALVLNRLQSASVCRVSKSINGFSLDTSRSHMTLSGVG